VLQTVRHRFKTFASSCVALTYVAETCSADIN